MFTILDKNFSGLLSDNIEDYPEGIVLPVDKPYRWTSADVIRKIKYAACRHFGKKKLKVGHAGTLDPLATGVLLVCIGNATKQAETLQAHDKEYVAGIAFGATTPSYDLEKEIDRRFPYEHITAPMVENALQGFLGEQDQIAPLFSAKSVDGVRAYELARKLYKEQGGSLDEAAAELIRTSHINISDIELLDFQPSSGNLKYAGIGKNNSGIPCRDVDNPAVSDGNVDNRTLEDEAVYRSAVPEKKSASLRIHVTDNSALGLPRADLRIACTKGTYIRAFARDLGEALGSGAHLDALQRSRSGQFSVADALSVDEAMAWFVKKD